MRVDRLGAASPACMAQWFDGRYADCVDESGRRYGDHVQGLPPCQGEACGKISSICSDTKPCDEGLICRSTVADPSVTAGYCTLPCEDQPCPVGTRCALTQDPRSGETMRLCHQTCSGPADCEPYGRRQCLGATDTESGLCL